MADERNDLEAQHRARRRLIHRATLYTLGFLAATLVVAAGGAALVAFLLSAAGMPFLETWLVVFALVLLVPILALLVRAVRRRSPPGDG